MVTAIVPFVLVLVGLALYILGRSDPYKEIGRITFAAGIFAIAFAYTAVRFSM